MKNKKLLAPALAILLLTPAVLDMPKSYASEAGGSNLSENSPEKEIATKKTELAKLEQEKTQTEEKLGKVNEDLNQLNKKKNQTENELNDKVIKIKSNESLIDTNTSKEKLDKKIEELNGNIDENKKSLEKAKEEGEEIQKQVDELEAKDKNEEGPKNEIDAEAEKKKAEELAKKREEEVETARKLNRIYNDARQTLIEVKIEHGILAYKYKVKNEFLKEVLANPGNYKTEDIENYQKEVAQLANDFEASKLKIKKTEEAVKVAKDNQIAFTGFTYEEHTSESLDIGKEESKHKSRSDFKNNTLSQKAVEDKIIELNKEHQDALESYFNITKNYKSINDTINQKYSEREKIELENEISNGRRRWLFSIQSKSKNDFYYLNNAEKVKKDSEEDYKEYKQRESIKDKINEEISTLTAERKSIKFEATPYEEKRIKLENQLVYYKELLELIKNGGPKEEDSKEDPRLKELREKLLSNKTNVSNLENIIRNLQKELDHVKSDKKKIDSLTDEDRAKLSSELDTLKGEKEEIQARLNEINSNMASKNQEKERLEKILADLNDKIARLTKEIDDLNLYLYNQNSIYYYPSMINEKSSEEKVKEIRQRSINKLKIAYTNSVKVVDNAEHYLQTAKMSDSKRDLLKYLINKQKELNKKVEKLINKYQLEFL